MTFYTYSTYQVWKHYFYLTSILKEENEDFSILPVSNNIHDVHDKLYRELFSNPKEFALFLKEFLSYDISFESLLPYNNAFITEDFKNKRSDIVYKLKEENVYFFLEHQSSIDESMHYRIFEYYSHLLRDTINPAKLKNKNNKMPVIVPILFYTR